MTNVLLNDNNRHRKYTGVDKFHAAGYYGERVKAASGESWNMKYDPVGQVHDPLGIADVGYSGTHAVHTCCTFFQVAPKAQLYMLESTGGRYYSNGSYENKFLSKSADIIEKENITNMFTSLTTNNNTNWLNDMKKWLQDHPEFKQFWAAGNDDTDTFNPIMVIDEVFGVAAYTLMVNGDVVPAGYSSVSEYVDFSAPSMIYTYPEATKSTDDGCSHSGTSFSTPWLCGMSCLVDDFFIDKTGKPLTQKGMYQFFKDNTTDLKDDGFDSKTGWGAVRLPSPEKITISNYAQGGGETPMFTYFTQSKPRTDDSKFSQLYAKEYSALVEKISYDDIDEVGMSQGNQPTETMQSFYNRQTKKPHILINGGLFNMSNGKNILSFVDNGKEQNYQNNFVGFGVTSNDKTHFVKGVDKERQWWDFMTAYPLLIDNYKKTDSSTWGNATSINYGAKRQVVAYDDNYIYIMTVDANVKFDVVQTLLLELGVKYAFNLDGGGSVRTMVNGKVANNPSENRPVDNFVWVRLKENAKTEQTLPAKYKVVVKTSLNVRDTPNGQILTTMKNGDIIVVHEISDGWAKFSFGFDTGEVIYYYYCSADYIEYVEPINSTTPVKPEPTPTPSPEPEPKPNPEPEKDILDGFSDKNEISDWAVDAVRYCIEKGYIKGSNNKINPKTNITREELCVILERICKE